MAARYWVGGHPTNNNWNQAGSGTTNWSATSGGAPGASVPGSSDDVIFDGAGTGNSASTISASISVLSFTITSGYTNTITHNSTLTVSGNVTLVTGYTIAGTGTLSISGTSIMTSGGQVWPNSMSFSGVSLIKTLADNWTVLGTLSILSSSVVINATVSETLTCNGLTMTQPTSVGTAKIILSGGTWSGIQVLQNDLDIAGDVTISGTVAYRTKTLTYLSGTVTASGILNIAGNTTLNTAGIIWNDITLNSAGSSTITLTLNSLLSAVTINITGGMEVIWAGSFGFTVGTLNLSTIIARTSTLQNGVTYTVTSALTAFGTRIGSTLTFTSDHASNLANLILSPGATCNVLANFTRIDASGGRTINTFNGTVTSCVNVVAFNDLTKLASPSFNLGI